MTEDFLLRWRTFLGQWSNAVLSSPFGNVLPQDIVTTRWLGTSGATEAQLIGAEQHLNMALPPSYRAFLAVTNGWRLTAFPVERVQLQLWIDGEIDRLWASEELMWFSEKNKDVINIWRLASPFAEDDDICRDTAQDDGDGGEVISTDVDNVHGEHLAATLDIDTYEDGWLLLNPKVVTADGEWEAWYFNAELLGAIKQRSFWGLMQYLYQEFIAPL